MSMLVFEYDGGATIEQVKANYPGLEYFLYTSFNHQYDKHGTGQVSDRFRMVFPLAEPITPYFCDSIKHKLSVFAPGVDLSGEKISQPQSMPFHRPNTPFIAYRNEGKLLDVSKWGQKKVEHEPTFKTVDKRKGKKVSVS